MFESNEEIEISSQLSFNLKESIIKVRFLYKDPAGFHYGIDEEGYVRSKRFARKIEPKVEIYLNGEYGLCEKYYIPKSLADKIKAGNV